MSAENLRTFSFFRVNEGQRKEVQIRCNDLTVQRLATVFKLVPEGIFLEEEFSGRAEFPSEHGTFKTDDWSAGSNFRVEGELSHTTNNTAVHDVPSSSQFQSQTVSAAVRMPATSQFQSILRPSTSTSHLTPAISSQRSSGKVKPIRKMITIRNIEIVRGKPALGEVLSSHFLTFMENQASTAEITSLLSRQIDASEPMVLVDTKVNEIPEAVSGTNLQNTTYSTHCICQCV